MIIKNKITYVFNKFLIYFFKEIKKDEYFKLAIKKKYKVIDKNSDIHIKFFLKRILPFKELLCVENLELEKLLENTEFSELNIFKSINIERLFKVFKTDDDKNTILSYILTLLLLSLFYKESDELTEDLMKENNTEKVLDEDDEDEDDEDDGEDEDEKEDETYSKYDELEVMFKKTLELINNNKEVKDMENDINQIMDDDIRNLVITIKNIKSNMSNDLNSNEQLDTMLEDSQIGKLAKEISDTIDVDSLNIKNPEDLLNPSNLFGGENGNMLGNLVQQVGSSITNKINSGELKQEDLIKDAFSLMGNLQGSGSGSETGNPLFDNLLGNVMGGGGNQNNEGGLNMEEMMKNMMGGINMNEMTQMMNSMGGTQGLNQNNPNSREGKAKERLRKKLDEKNKNK